MGVKSKLLNLKDCAVNSMIYKQYYEEGIDENLVYLESRDGLDFTGNIFRIVEELSNEKYSNLKICVHAKKQVHPKIKSYQKNYNLRIDEIITKEAVATKTLEKAKYIFTDSGIRPKYVKKKGQIFVNTWHGTPLKLMGADNVSEQHRIGNVQHPLLSSDYLLYPNDYMKDKMLNSYMIEKIYPGKVLLEGYPRNSVFFDEDKRKKFKEKLGFQDKEVFIYMPTFRGLFKDRDDEKQKDEIYEYLLQLDGYLSDDQVFIVKLHVLNQERIDFSKFEHIKTFPEGYETYDVLNMADVLVTDYSSVFFDFANTKRKIILFNYDEDDYMAYRGTYFSLDDLPFPKVQTVEDLANELNLPKDYDDGEFLEKFCTYDRPDSVRYLCEHIIKGKNVCREETVKNDKENVLIFGGALFNNGITSSLLNLLNNVDLSEYNYFVSFYPWDEYIDEFHEEIFEKFPDGVEFLPFRFNITPTVGEKMDFNKYFLSEEGLEFPDSLKRLFGRSFVKQYGSIKFKAIIDYDGYKNDLSFIFSNSDAKNLVWVHNDMLQESRTKANQKVHILKDIYSQSSNVVVVSPDLIGPTSKICGDKSKINVVHNINNYERIIERSKMDLTIDEYTEVYNNDIFEVLKRPGKKFITIGRFSPEKGHERLLNAFDEFCNTYPDSQMIIIGGYGVKWDETIGVVDGLNHRENVTLINNISNPMPILKSCDLFVVSSFYEGWPMVIMEADTLNVPIVATDIVGTQWMKDYGGHIVEDSQEGILKGLNDFMNGDVGLLNIDYERYNKDAVDEFLSSL